MTISPRFDGGTTTSGAKTYSNHALCIGAFITAVTSATNVQQRIAPMGFDGTSSGVPVESVWRNGVHGIRFIRRLTGLTYEEIARFLGVSRRSIHNWENGRPVNDASEKAIAVAIRFSEALGELPKETLRGALLTAIGDGKAVVDIVQRDPGVALMAARLALTRPHRLIEPDLDTRKARVPLVPSVLLSAVEIPSNSMRENRRIAKVKRIRGA
jgi:transcriptional regulator with XRE-family HTH domain